MLGPLFRISYMTRGARVAKKPYSRFLGICGKGKEEVKVPVQPGLTGNGKRHTLEVSIHHCVQRWEVREAYTAP
jgi:hypothetical protein